MSSKNASSERRRRSNSGPNDRAKDPNRDAAHRSVNLPLLFGSLACLVLLTAGVLLLRWRRQHEIAEYFTIRAERLADEGDLRGAIAYQQRFLQLRTDDVEARQTLIQYVTDSLQSPSDRAYLIRLLSETIGLMTDEQSDERWLLRAELAEQTLENAGERTILLATARDEAKQWLYSDGEPNVPNDSSESMNAEVQARMQRVFALSKTALIPPASVASQSERLRILNGGGANDDGVPVLTALEDAIASNPTDATLAYAAATLYRQFPEVAPDASHQADAIMDRLVETAPNDADALLANYQYREFYLLPDADSQLDAALAADPEHFAANLLAGRRAARRRDAESLEIAKQHFQSAVAANPQNEQGLLALARLHWSMGEQNEAIATLREASERLPQLVAIFVQLPLAEYLLESGDVKEAAAVVASVADRFELQLRRLPTTTRRTIANQVRVLEGKLALAREDWPTALARFQAVLASDSDLEGDGTNDVASRQAREGLARVFLALRQWDRAAPQFARFADQLEESIRTPTARPGAEPAIQDAVQTLFNLYVSARGQSADAFLRARQPEEALRQIDLLSRRAQVSGSILVLQLLAELELRLLDPPPERNWAAFQSYLQQARQESPDNAAVLFAEIRYLQATATGDSAESAIVRRLEEELDRFSDDREYWLHAARTFHSLNRVDDAEQAIQRYCELESDPSKQLELKVAHLVATKQPAAVDELLDGFSLGDEESNASLKRRLRLWARFTSGDSPGALELAKQIAESESIDRDTLSLAFEVAVSQQAAELADSLESRLSRSGAYAPTELAYFCASRLLENYSGLAPGGQSELAQLIAEVRSDRPNWIPAARLAARHAEARGDFSAAIRAWDAVLSLGDRRPETLQRLSQLLHRSGEYDRAQAVLDQLYAVSGDNVAIEVDGLAIATAVKRQRIEEALESARRSVADHPDDSVRRIWLYSVLVERQKGSSDSVVAEQFGNESTEVIEQAHQDFPDDVLVWGALLEHRIRRGDVDTARTMIEEKLPAALAADELARLLVQAEAYRRLGDLDAARGRYVAALELRPSRVATRLKLAELLLQSDVPAATEQYEAILQLEPNNDVARRGLAALLAAAGPTADWRRIEQLLSGDSETSSIVDDRLRATLLLRRGATVDERRRHCELAIQILLEVVNASYDAPLDMDRLLLAGAYEQLATLYENVSYFDSARRQLRFVVDRADASSAYKNLYLAFLIRSLEQMQTFPESEAAAASFANDAESRLQTFRRSDEFQTASKDPLVELAILGLEIRRLSVLDEADAAVEKIQEAQARLLDDELDEAIRVRLLFGFGSLYSTLQRFDLAEPFFRDLAAASPAAKALLSQSLIQQGRAADAVNVFLPKEGDSDSLDAVALAGVLAAAQDDDAFQEAWPLVAAAVEENSDDVALLSSVAVLQVTRNNQVEAIRLLRKVIAKAPDDVVALNNLATLLGEDPSSRSEALALINQAIEAAGPQPGLLDTKGTIELHLGKASDAIASLEQSVANVNVDPRYYFHLAAAYFEADRQEDARDSLRRARQRGLDDAVLTEADRELLRRLDSAIPTTVNGQSKAS